jgi:hypothetical protein
LLEIKKLSNERRAAVPSQLVNRSRKLTWADYKGRVVPANSSFAAQTAMNFTVNRSNFQQGSGGFSLVDQVTVTVVFDPQRSWVQPQIAQASATTQQFLLDHEQGHYDICALFARDCFIKLMSLKTLTWQTQGSGSNDFNWYFTLYHDRWLKTDAEYDSQTGHSQANVFVPSTNVFTPPPQKGQPQLQWEGLIDQAFNTVRLTGEIAPDGHPYKIELSDVLRNAGITIP